MQQTAQEIHKQLQQMENHSEKFVALSEKIAVCNLEKQNVPFNTGSWVIIQVINLFYNAFWAHFSIQIKGQ